MCVLGALSVGWGQMSSGVSLGCERAVYCFMLSVLTMNLCGTFGFSPVNVSLTDMMGYGLW